MMIESDQKENMKLKSLKAQHGEPLCWTDYLSLPFTQTVYIYIYMYHFQSSLFDGELIKMSENINNKFVFFPNYI
jgi:hypothetical protein